MKYFARREKNLACIIYDHQISYYKSHQRRKKKKKKKAYVMLQETVRT